MSLRASPRARRAALALLAGSVCFSLAGLPLAALAAQPGGRLFAIGVPAATPDLGGMAQVATPTVAAPSPALTTAMHPAVGIDMRVIRGVELLDDHDWVALSARVGGDGYHGTLEVHVAGTVSALPVRLQDTAGLYGAEFLTMRNVMFFDLDAPSPGAPYYSIVAFRVSGGPKLALVAITNPDGGTWIATPIVDLTAAMAGAGRGADQSALASRGTRMFVFFDTAAGAETFGQLVIDDFATAPSLGAVVDLRPDGMGPVSPLPNGADLDPASGLLWVSARASDGASRLVQVDPDPVAGSAMAFPTLAPSGGLSPGAPLLLSALPATVASPAPEGRDGDRPAASAPMLAATGAELESVLFLGVLASSAVVLGVAVTIVSMRARRRAC